MAVRPGKLMANSTAFFLCDMQEGFRASTLYYPEIINVAQRMVTAANILEIPVIATEHDEFGCTVKEITTISFKDQIFSKTNFSMVTPEVVEYLQQRKGIKSIVLMGIVTHVCVLQTALDLLERNYDVHVIADGVSSSTMVERMYGIERLRQSGAYITTSETVLCMLVGDTKHPKYEEIQALYKTPAPDSRLLSKL